MHKFNSFLYFSMQFDCIHYDLQEFNLYKFLDIMRLFDEIYCRDFKDIKSKVKYFIIKDVRIGLCINS